MKNEIKEKFMYSIECKTKVVNDEKIIGQVIENNFYQSINF